MINFENMTIEQMKKYLLPGELQKLEVPELGQLLSASRGIYQYFCGKFGIEEVAEAAFWKAAEEQLLQEFKQRNIEVKVLSLTDLYGNIDNLLKTNYQVARQVLVETFTHFGPEALLETKQKLMEIPNCDKHFGRVLAILNEYLGISDNRSMLN